VASTCNTCKFYNPRDVPTPSGALGSCHRRAPTQLPDVHYRDGVRVGWPVVRPEDFCGEYAPRDAADGMGPSRA
jgi:hypothetical protein